MAGADVSLEQFIGMLGRGVVAHASFVEATLRKASHVIEVRAKEMIGHERQEWPPLAQATKDERVALGFTENDPLERTHALENAIESEVELHRIGGDAVIGVKDATVGDGSKADPIRNIGDVAVWMELGTKKAPPRPFLSQAVIDEMKKLEVIFGKDLAGSLFALDQNSASVSTAAIPGIPKP